MTSESAKYRGKNLSESPEEPLCLEFEESTDGMQTIDMQGNLMQCNSSFVEMGWEVS